MDGIPKKKQKKHTPITTLPHKIIENILSRIPVKYLYRFKSVSKKWKSTISDPTFARTHLQESKKKSNLVAWEEERDFQGLVITKLHNNKFRFVSAIEHPWEEQFAQSMSRIVCYCDGLYLKPCHYYYEYNGIYVLWNPSTRTYRKLSCPYPVDPRLVLHAICYDPLTKDYKVVIADMKHYAVFSCRNKKWCDPKEMEDYSWGDRFCRCKSGISLNGSYYWMINIPERLCEVYAFIIVCFDCKDEKLKKVPNPFLNKEPGFMVDLAIVGGHLCSLIVRGFSNGGFEMTIMRKEEDKDVWMEFKINEEEKNKKKHTKRKKNQKTKTPITTTLPHEIIENILSRIPAKYLSRFRTVCKKWNSTISSDPTFAEIHPQQQSKNSSSRNLLAWEETYGFEGFYVARLQQNGTFRYVSSIEHPWHEDMAAYGIASHCHGLYLKLSCDGDDKQSYVLWNPSTATYKKLSCPYQVNSSLILCGICYDSSTKDYKVVIADMKHYATFSCRYNKWGEVKEMDTNIGFSCDNSGFSINGSCYWILVDRRREEGDEFEIICFDSRDEELKKVKKPNIEVGVDDMLDLAPIGGHLCLLVTNFTKNMSMEIMKKDEIEDAWMEFKVTETLSSYYRFGFQCICSINEDEIVLACNDSNLTYQL